MTGTDLARRDDWDDDDDVRRDLSRAVGADDELSVIDKRIIDIAAKYNGNISPAALAEEVGFNVSPARVAMRLREILNSRDWLSIQHKIALVIEDMVELKQFVKQRRDENAAGDVVVGITRDGAEIYSQPDPRWAMAYQKVLASIEDSLRQAFKMQKDATAKISAGNAQIMIAAIEKGWGKFIFSLLAAYPDVDELFARNLMQDALEATLSVIQESTLD